MGKKAKGSRKGKKAWRANISTEDIEEFFEKSTKDALSGGSLQAVSSDSLFFEDKSKDLAVKKKIEKHREKVLRVDSVLLKNQFVKPVPSSILKKGLKNRKAVSKVSGANQDSHKDDSVLDSDTFDLWGAKDADEVSKKGKKVSKPTTIPAVEVDPPGCSFNPSYESHQDTLASAVAEEMQKIYKNELGPEPVPLTVPGESIAEEADVFDAGMAEWRESQQQSSGCSSVDPVEESRVARSIWDRAVGPQKSDRLTGSGSMGPKIFKEAILSRRSHSTSESTGRSYVAPNSSVEELTQQFNQRFKEQAEQYARRLEEVEERAAEQARRIEERAAEQARRIEERMQQMMALMNQPSRPSSSHMASYQPQQVMGGSFQPWPQSYPQQYPPPHYSQQYPSQQQYPPPQQQHPPPHEQAYQPHQQYPPPQQQSPPPFNNIDLNFNYNAFVKATLLGDDNPPATGGTYYPRDEEDDHAP